jgi:hypothetical protein
MKPVAFLARCAIAFAFALPLPALADTDYTDTWWTPSEPGWGVNLTQQANFVYGTFYVYGPDGKATWFSAQMTRDGTAERFTGPLFRITGTWFGAPVWNGYQIAQAGTATFAATTAQSGVLSYSVDGATFSKPVERIFLAPVNVAGLYVGAVSFRRSGCAASGPYSEPVQLDVLYSTATGSLRIDQLSAAATGQGQLVCRMEGTAVQRGKILAADGASYTCSGGWTSTARIYNLRPTPGGIEGQYYADAGGGCIETGQFSGVTQYP